MIYKTVRLMVAAFAVWPWLASPAGAAPTPPPLPESAIKDLAHVLRKMIIQNLPPVLYEGNDNWGHQSNSFHALTWRANKGGIRAEVHRKPKNDGMWRKVRVTPRHPETTLAFDLRNWQYAAAERMTFKALLVMDVNMEFEQQLWESGIRLYGGSTRARMRVLLSLDCELLLRVETTNSFLPDFIFRLRVLKSDLAYDNLVVEHTAGIGGTGAKLLGEALHRTVTQLRPDLERDLLAKANAAIVKTADTREVRLSLGSLLAPVKK